MATVFSHAAIPLALAVIAGSSRINKRLLVLGILCSIIPDFDVIGFRFGVAYASNWGHRGITHSIFFSLLMASVFTLFHRSLASKPLTVWLFTFVSMVSHPLLDAMTTGGLGVAAFWPLSDDRYFLPWQVIRVSPIGSRFFSSRGMETVISELMWIWLPVLLIVCSTLFIRYVKKRRTVTNHFNH